MVAPVKWTVIMTVNKEQVLAALAKVPSPGGTALPDARVLSDVVVSEGKVFFSLTVDATSVKMWEPVRKAAEDAVRAIPGVQSALVALTAERSAGPAARAPQSAAQAAPRAAHPADKVQPGIPGVDAVIAVASGKGGVGKSTTAVNLALGLRDLGLKIGMLDADIYGPSLPKLLAIKEKPQTIGGTRLKPIERYGLTVMSIGFLIDEDTPMIWRGPMVMSAITQMLREV
jgi:ATP-binding protein involved in chromosome partitioning